jgi:lipoprotein NlpI
MKRILAKLGLVVAAIAVLALFAWGTRMALRPISHGLALSYFNQGFREQKAGNYDAALIDYDRAIALDPKFSIAFLNRGMIKAGQGHTEEAIADFDRAIELDPKEYRSYYGRARGKEALGDLPGALADYDRCIGLNPKLTMAISGRSHVKALLGNMEGAMEDANQMIALQPDEHAFVRRGWLKRVNGDLDGARTDFDRAIQINSRFGVSYVSRGCLNYVARQWDDALKDFRRSCVLSDEAGRDYSQIYIWLTRTRQGEGGEADKELAAYLEERRPGKISSKGEWASKVAKFLLGRITEDELFAAAKTANAKDLRGQLCEAWYYAGEKKWLAGDRESAAQYFRKCLQTERIDFEEYAFAKVELKALGE